MRWDVNVRNERSRARTCGYDHPCWDSLPPISHEGQTWRCFECGCPWKVERYVSKSEQFETTVAKEYGFPERGVTVVTWSEPTEWSLHWVVDYVVALGRKDRSAG